MLTSPPTRLPDPVEPPVAAAPAAATSPHATITLPARGEPVGTAVADATAARVVTAEQVERAVLQLRERPGKTAVEQMQAVLQALGLTVAPPHR
ncbi:hypothetical protein ACQPWY_33045 [Pseudonocardia xinjiangensis]|uniref:hypothetical protein n=1 Tax=Pseudonocardia xinjiangensis TaxID=75289 RepID=UPI003D92DEAF